MIASGHAKLQRLSSNHTGSNSVATGFNRSEVINCSETSAGPVVGSGDDALQRLD